MARRISTVERGEPVVLNVNGREERAYAGETVAAALLAADINTFHRSKSGRPRGPFCNMGTCFECLVRVARSGQLAAHGWLRACMTTVEAGMTVVTGEGLAGDPASADGNGPAAVASSRGARERAD